MNQSFIIRVGYGYHFAVLFEDGGYVLVIRDEKDKKVGEFEELYASYEFLNEAKSIIKVTL